MISKHKFILFIAVLLFTRCETHKSTVRFKGRAYNGKAGAYIFTKDKNIYNIKGVEEWPEKYYGKKLIVKGKLTILYDTSTTDNQERQRIYIKQDIDSAKYRISIFGFIRKHHYVNQSD